MNPNIHTPPPPIPSRPAQPVPRNISHVAHAVATLLTLGAWSPVWLIASLVTSQRNKNNQEAYARALSYYEYQMAYYFANARGMVN